MKLINSGALLVLAIFASLCCAAPVQEPRSPKKDAAPMASVVPNTEPQAAQPSPITSSARPKATSSTAKPMAAATSMTQPKASAPSNPQAQPQPAAAGMGPPVLLSQLTALQAGGGVPSGPPPATSFSPTALSAFRVANFIEGIESAFFANVLQSLSQDPTFTNVTADGRSIANITTQIAAQELVHKATLEGLLGLAMQPTVPACQSLFPVTNTTDYLAKANVVTAAAIGVIITILATISQTDSPNLLVPLGGILSCESQQDAFFRMSGSNVPSASPFNTALSTAFAYNIALTFVDPRSCPQLLPLPIYPSLNLTSPMMAATAPATPPTSITFTASGVPQDQALFVGFINQANPVTYSKVTITNGIGTADIPAGMSGIAFAALTPQNTIMTVDGLTNVTLAGPAAILMS